MTQQYASNQPDGYNNYLKNIAIVGAGGTIGKYIVDHLQPLGKHNITALTRKGSGSKLPSGISSKEVNYDDPATFVSALQGQDCLIITLNATAAPGTHDMIVKAAAEAKIPWLIPNEWGINPPKAAGEDTKIGVWKQKERDYIEELGVSKWIAVSSGFWYEFSLAGSPDRYGFDLKKKTVTFFDDGLVKMNTSTWNRTGEAIAALLSLKILPQDSNDDSLTLSHFKNRFLHISSFFLNQKEMFEALKRATQTKDEDWSISNVSSKERVEAAVKQMQSGDRQAFSRLLYTRMFYPEAPADFNDKLDNKSLGLQEEDLDEATKRAVKLQADGYFDSQY